ncbi:hypothetical protein INR49_009002 [Caranx melampygus]|nr:hypothetical protein INR49_009048 [Caranx melampygus]KAG7232142.1 hypothetical protein INR49_009500 [Caranx melampygus]KAG7232342.1 hypothetical protein INR49_009002 [Caranx melampygus]
MKQNQTEPRREEVKGHVAINHPHLHLHHLRHPMGFLGEGQVEDRERTEDRGGQMRDKRT